jgi:hypothetical protein
LLIKLALHIYEGSLCQCGHSSFLAHGYEGTGEYRGRTTTCHACAIKDRRKQTDAPGVKFYTQDLHDHPRDDDDLDDEDGDDDG